MSETLPPDFAAEAAAYPGPSEDIRRQLGRKVIVPVIGPTAIGKSTIMEQACAQTENFSRVRSFTTRPQRSGEPDDTYYFLPHDGETFRNLQAKIADRSLVQLAIHPVTNHIYGTEIHSYPARHNILDTLSGSVDNLRRLPFGACIPVAIATEANDWHDWFLERHRQNRNLTDSANRLDEAELSLRWSLNRANYDVVWMRNHPGRVSNGVRYFIQVVEGSECSDKDARRLGNSMLKSVPLLRKRLARYKS